MTISYVWPAAWLPGGTGRGPGLAPARRLRRRRRPARRQPMQERAARQDFHVAQLTRGQAVLVLSSAAVMLSIAMGLRQSFGLFQTPVVQDLGLQAADFAMAIAVQNIIWGVTQPVAGAFVDRYGPRLIAVVGVLLYAAGVAITALATSAAAITLGTGVLVGIALSC